MQGRELEQSIEEIIRQGSANDIIAVKKALGRAIEIISSQGEELERLRPAPIHGALRARQRMAMRGVSPLR